MKDLFALIFIPIMLLNFLGGIISGIWLAIDGEWWAIGLGILGVFISTKFLFLVLMPGMLAAVPGALLLEKRKKFLGALLITLSSIYTYCVMSAWCLGVFFTFISKSNEHTFLPLLIWSYGVALGPWMYMAQMDQKSGGEESASVIATMSTQFAYIAMSLVAIFGNYSLLIPVILFGVIMVVGFVLQSVISYFIFKEREARRNPFNHLL